MSQPTADRKSLVQNTCFLLFLLLKKLRFTFLYSGDVRQKISLSYAMQDCKFAIEALPEADLQGDPRECAYIDGTDVAQLQTDAIAPGPLDIDSYRHLIRLIDGNTTYLETIELRSAATARRAIENLASTLRIPLPAPDSRFAGRKQGVRCGEIRLTWPEVPERPGRPAAAVVTDRASHQDHHPLLRALYEQMFTIEFPAGEVCAAIPLRFPDIPLELDLTLAQQTYEEGRHANLVLPVFESLGGKLDLFDPCFDIWNNSLLGQTAAECLCIENFLGEGYALGSDNMAAKEYRESGRRDLESIYLSLQADEIMHVKQGVLWFRKLAGSEARTIVERLEEKVAVCPPPDPWFDPELRSFVGFSEQEIHRQRKHRDARSTTSG